MSVLKDFSSNTKKIQLSARTYCNVGFYYFVIRSANQLSSEILHVQFATKS